jgi:hypothetical protein
MKHTKHMNKMQSYLSYLVNIRFGVRGGHVEMHDSYDKRSNERKKIIDTRIVIWVVGRNEG